MLFCPIAIFRYRCVAFVKLDETKSNITTTPPTTLYIPKSSTPKACNVIRVVNNVINIVNNILIYNTNVFLLFVYYSALYLSFIFKF